MATPIPEDREAEDKVPELGAASQPRRVRSISLRPRAGDGAVHFFSGVPEDGVMAGNLLPPRRTSGVGGDTTELMGPIVRRKKVVSMPLGAGPGRNEFFGGESQEFTHVSGRVRQSSGGSFTRRPSGQSPHQSPRARKKQSSLMQGILKRKQVSLDLFAPEEDDEAEAFFAPLPDEKELAPTEVEAEGEPGKEVEPTEEAAAAAAAEKEEPPVKLFKPLIFSKPLKPKGGGGGGHGGGHGGISIDDEVREYLEAQLEGQMKMKKKLEELAEDETISERGVMQEILRIQNAVDSDTEKIQLALGLEQVVNDEGPGEVPGAVEEGVELSEEDAKRKEEIKQKVEDLATQLVPISGEIKKATRKDYIKTGILVCIMIAFLAVVLAWHTEIDEAYAVFGPVGLACSTQCLGHKQSQNYFRSHGHFDTGDFVKMFFRLDPHPDEHARALVQIYGRESGHTKKLIEFGPPDAMEHVHFEKDVEVDSSWDHPHEDHLVNVYSVYEGSHVGHGVHCHTPCLGNSTEESFFAGEHSSFKAGEYLQFVMLVHPSERDDTLLNAEIVGVESGEVKASATFGPAGADAPEYFTATVEVGFDNPEEEHIVNVYTAGEEDDVEFELFIYTNNNTVLSFTLHTATMTPLAKYSELIAALIMIFVYLFILLETIHRTLVAIFGSMVALFFFFLIYGGETESVRTLMLHMEWSTLGLLFGMMVIVGELSHTGVFEWLSVRLLVASKGSFVRLIVLLCLLTAVSSAFLDNVTTMLLLAPVTIDMASILNVDPRPYLIGEVLLSNVGGTATLIGDPPNIIIGSAFDEIGFVDFIIEIAPMIFIFAIPVSIGLVVYLYKFYLTSTKMPELDVTKLKQTYQVYDEPRLMIAGTVAFFVILIFFLHPLHHKDTAWISLIGAFITISFTNPHDVQDALRNHVEWDTLLFFGGLFVLVEVCAALGLLQLIGNVLAGYIEDQPEEDQLTVAITLILWVSAITSAFLDNIPYTATMIPVVRILAEKLPDTLPIKTLAWALSFGACLGGNGTLLGASANIVTAGISTSRGYEISFLNFFYPGFIVMIATVAIANLYMLIIYVWI